MDQKAMRVAPEPPARLIDGILLRIAAERRHRLVRKAWAFGAALAASLALVASGWEETAVEASHSGFFVFTSLFFSDFSAAAAHFSDFTLSAVESFPALAAAIFLSGVFFAIWSAAKFANGISLLRRRAPFMGNGFANAK